MTYLERVKAEAQRIVKKYESVSQHESGYYDLDLAKECALIAVDEIIQAKQITDKRTMEYKYWQNVKKEINKF